MAIFYYAIIRAKFRPPRRNEKPAFTEEFKSRAVAQLQASSLFNKAINDRLRVALDLL